MAISNRHSLFSSPHREAITADLRRGIQQKQIAARYGYSRRVIASYAASLKADDAERASDDPTGKDSLLRSLTTIRQRLETALDDVHRTSGPQALGNAKVLAVLKEARAVLAQIAAVTGITKTGVQIGIQFNGASTPSADGHGPDAVRMAILKGLTGHPEARESVCRELLALQGGQVLIEDMSRDERVVV